MKRISLLLATILLFSLLLAACSPSPTPSPTPQPLVFTDGLNRTVSLESPAKRIVSLAPSITEVLYAIGAGSQVVGRDEFSNYPAEAQSLPSVGGSFGGYSTEAIVALQPDLVLAAEINTAEQVKTLEDVGLTVFLVPNPTDLEGMYQFLEIVAQMAGHELQADQLIASLKARVAAVADKIAGVSDKPLVFYELDSTDPNAPYTAGAGTFIDLLIGLAGGRNTGAVLTSAWAQISLEELLIQDPDIILLGDAAYGVTPESVAQRPGWEALSAVKNGKVFPFNDDLLSRPGPRLVDGLEALAKLLHPEVFK